MSTYTLPREAYDLLVETLGEKSKAETLAHALERILEAIEAKADEAIVERKAHIKIELKDELRQELVTRELFEERFARLESEMRERFNVVDERFNVVDEKFRSLNFKLNIFIVIALLALTLANPTFVALLEKVFGLP